MRDARPWRLASEAALYGPDGFYRENRPADHFRTSVQAGSGRFAEAIAALLDRVDTALSHPDPIDFVDVGAGAGELLTAVAGLLEASLASRVRLIGTEVRSRPPELLPTIGWAGQVPALTGLLLANEWLDTVPVDVVERDDAGADRLVLVSSTTGAELLGPVVTGSDASWLKRWWPLSRPGDRAEIGATRDVAWAAAAGRVRRGLAVAVDYGHLASARPAGGTLTGYRNGRQVRPVPDGSCDLTAHVAVDAVAALGGDLHRQRDVLRTLGVTGALPPRAQAGSDPLGYLNALAAASAGAELTDPAGLGGFWWLVRPVGAALRKDCLAF